MTPSHHVPVQAVSSDRLYGDYNQSTQTWEDGVVTVAARSAMNAEGAPRFMVVLDGPVDHVWVEALNPVLDDNKTLCLHSGETIPLRPGINFIMEVGHCLLGVSHRAIEELCVCVCLCVCTVCVCVCVRYVCTWRAIRCINA